jgi:hypothetical protein
MRTALVSLLFVACGCNDGAVPAAVGDLGPTVAGDLALADLAPRACGSSACTADQACVVVSLRPPCDAGSCNSQRCVTLPAQCQNDRTCACLNQVSTPNFCYQLGPNLQCGTGGAPSIELICSST